MMYCFINLVVWNCDGSNRSLYLYYFEVGFLLEEVVAVEKFAMFDAVNKLN